jgi:hypothetical protein
VLLVLPADFMACNIRFGALLEGDGARSLCLQGRPMRLARLNRIYAFSKLSSQSLGLAARICKADCRVVSETGIARLAAQGEPKDPALTAAWRNPQMKVSAVSIEARLLQVLDGLYCETMLRSGQWSAPRARASLPMFLPMFRSSILPDFGGQSQMAIAPNIYILWGKYRHRPTWADTSKH